VTVGETVDFEVLDDVKINDVVVGTLGCQRAVLAGELYRILPG
jgi:hypothetical protein